jgi:CelD/BcsL family acetyltransferase involved in cellulose biosynthesis
MGAGRPERRLEICDSLADVRDSWLPLALESRNIFGTWEWASTWWRHYGGGSAPQICVWRERSGVRALLPLYVWSRRPLRIARFIGHGPADQLGPIGPANASAAVADLLWEASGDLGADLLLAELLPGNDAWSGRFHRPPLLTEASPTIALTGGWEQYLDTRSANLRQQIRRRRRRLEQRYSVRLRLAAARHLQDDLTLFFALHGERWGRRSAFRRFEPFQRDFAAVALDQGWLRLWFLELDDRPAAAWLGFRFAGVESYYQAGRDPRFDDASVGFVLLAHSIREAAEDGMDEYRLLRGAEAFKARLADADAGVHTFALTRGARGTVARAAAAAALRSGPGRVAARRIARR